jgi:hypothetical protein
MISSLRVYDIVSQALQLCGAFAYGEQIDPDLARTAITQLNLIRAEWALTFMGWKRFDEAFVATTATRSVTMGDGGDIASMPASISSVTISMGPNINRPVPLRSLDEYRNITYPEIYAVPTAAYQEPGYPLFTLWLYPGLQAGYGVRIVGQAVPTDYENIGDTIEEPAAFVQAMISELALQMAPMLGKPVDGLLGRASAAKKHLKRANFAAQMGTISPNAAPFNWQAGF